MRKALSVVMGKVIFIVIAMIVVLVLVLGGKGAIDSGSKQTDAASSGAISLSERSIPCDIFCDGKIGSADDANSRCYSLPCNGKTYGFTCVYSPTAFPSGKCTEACKGASDIPESCKISCSEATLKFKDCPTYRLTSFLSGSCMLYTKAATPSECPASTDPCTSEGCTPPADGSKVCCKSSGSDGGGGGSGGVGGGGSGGGDGGTGIILEQKNSVGNWDGVSSISKPSQPTRIWRVSAADSTRKKPVSTPTVTLRPSGSTTDVVKCASTSGSCADGISANEDCYTVPCFSVVDAGETYEFYMNAPLKDGSYSVEVTAALALPEGEKTRTVSLSWRCPTINVVLLGGKKFGPGTEVTAEFESNILPSDSVAAKLNTQVIPGLTTSGNVAKFTIPGVSGGLLSGQNKLVVERRNSGYCIKSEGGVLVVKNDITKTYSWTCPAKGCFTQSGKKYVITGLQNGGGCIDPDTGCSYSNMDQPCATAANECLNGCIGGECNAPKLEVSNIKVKVDGVLIPRASKIYESKYDRIVTVVVKNTGTFGAIKLYNGMTAKITDSAGASDDLVLIGAAGTAPGGSADDPLIPNNNPLDLGAGEQGEYFFSLPVDGDLTNPDPVPLKVPFTKMTASFTLSGSAKASNMATATSWSRALTLYSCGARCDTYAKSDCDACASPCKWVETASPKCTYTCGMSCSTQTTLTDCIACPDCAWSSTSNPQCDIKPFHTT